MGTVRLFTLILGIAFVVAGVAGYVPALTSDGMLFGIFAVDSMHNVVHIVSGAIALYASTRDDFDKIFCKVFGIIYTVVAVLGFWKGADMYMIHPNMADNWLHLVIGVASLYFGYYFERKTG